MSLYNCHRVLMCIYKIYHKRSNACSSHWLSHITRPMQAQRNGSDITHHQSIKESLFIFGKYNTKLISPPYIISFIHVDYPLFSPAYYRIFSRFYVLACAY